MSPAPAFLSLLLSWRHHGSHLCSCLQGELVPSSCKSPPVRLCPCFHALHLLLLQGTPGLLQQLPHLWRLKVSPLTSTLSQTWYARRWVAPQCPLKTQGEATSCRTSGRALALTFPTPTLVCEGAGPQLHTYTEGSLEGWGDSSKLMHAIPRIHIKKKKSHDGACNLCAGRAGQAGLGFPDQSGWPHW